MELNETFIQDIKLNGELTKQHLACFEKMSVKKEILSVIQKGEIFRRKVDGIYDNFEIWDGLNFIKPILPIMKRKDKFEKIKKKNFIVENLKKIKIPLIKINNSSKIHYDKGSNNEEINSHKRINIDDYKTTNINFLDTKSPLKLSSIGPGKPLDTKKLHLHTSSLIKRSNTVQSSQNLFSKIKKASDFFMTDPINEVDEEVKNNSKQKYCIKTSHSIKKMKTIVSDCSKTMKIDKIPDKNNFITDFKTKEYETPSRMESELKKHSALTFLNKKEGDLNNHFRTELNEGKETEKILSTNGITSTADDVHKNKFHNFIYHDKFVSDNTLNFRKLNITPTKSYSKSQLEFKSNSSKKECIYSKCELISNENTKVNQEIVEEKRCDKMIFNDKDYAKIEKEQLKINHSQKILVGEVIVKGQKRYISTPKANILRLSDSVVKMGEINVYKFYDLLNKKYEVYAKVSGAPNKDDEKHKKILIIKENNLKQNNRKMKNIMENILTICTKYIKKKTNKKQDLQ